MIQKAAILIFFIIEVALLTYWNEYFGALKSPLLLFICSLGIGVFSLNTQIRIDISGVSKKWYLFLIPLLGAILIGLTLDPIYKDNPISFTDVSQSDVIPQIGFMVQRLFHGTFPYEVINEWGYPLNPTYLPLQWLPFSIAELSGIDYRWVPFLALTMALFYYQFMITKLGKNALVIAFCSLIPWIIWWMIIDDEPKVMAFTIEPLLTAYYLFLGLSLLTKNKVLIAMAIVFCLLSRFSIVLWLPLFGLVTLLENRKRALQIAGMVVAAVLLIYVIPFLSQDWHIFSNGMAHHTKAAVDEWAPYWQQAGEKPYHLFRGVGLAAFFYEWMDGEIIDKIRILQIWHVVTIALSLIGLFAFYLRQKQHLSLPVFFIASLKIYFCFFYHFIQIPYIYLMMVPLFTSVLLVTLVLNKTNSSRLN